MKYKVGDEVFLRVKFCGKYHHGMEDWSVVESCNSHHSYGAVRNEDLIPSPIEKIEEEKAIRKNMTNMPLPKHEIDRAIGWYEGLTYALKLLKGETE